MDPNTLYPWQTWERWAEGKFPLSSSADYASGSTGGEATHTLTINEMPSHAHSYGIANSSVSGNEDYHGEYSGKKGIIYTQNTNPNGGSQPHNNMPPYQAVPYWIRTA